MTNGRPSILSAVLPAMLVALVGVLVLAIAPDIIRSIRHQDTVSEVQSAGLRLTAAAQSADETAAPGGILTEISRATRDLANFVRPSVVHVTGVNVTTRQGRWSRQRYPMGVSTGSGWLWDDAGHVVTNFHVVEGVDELEVELYDGEIRSATVVGTDPTTDIAVLKIDSGRLIPATRRSLDQILEQGELCFAFGSPFDLRFSMSSGIISGLGRDMYIQAFGNNFIQVDAAINPGNSGGPLTDAMGRVIGMNTAIATGETEPDRQQFAGIGLAIPIDVIESVVDQVVNDGTIRKGFLGVHVLDQDQPLAFWLAQHNFRGSGVLVSKIGADHPGRAAGLEIGDIITNYDSAPTTNSGALEELVRADVDDTTRVRVWRYDRNGAEWIDVEWRRGGTTTSGLVVHDLSDRISEHHHLLGCPSQGVLVSIVRDNEPAHRAGMQSGDVITSVNTRPVLTVQQLQSRISSIRPGQTAVLDVWRYDVEAGAGAMLQVDVELAQLGGTD